MPQARREVRRIARRPGAIFDRRALVGFVPAAGEEIQQQMSLVVDLVVPVGRGSLGGSADDGRRCRHARPGAEETGRGYLRVDIGGRFVLQEADVGVFVHGQDVQVDGAGGRVIDPGRGFGEGLKVLCVCVPDHYRGGCARVSGV